MPFVFGVGVEGSGDLDVFFKLASVVLRGSVDGLRPVELGGTDPLDVVDMGLDR